jgi:Family of unknown function (DUF6263)
VLRCRWLIVLPAMALLAAPALGQVDLKLKLDKGKPFYQEVTTETKQDMTVMGMKISQTQKQTFYFSWTPKDKDKDGNWIVTQKIEGVKLDIEIGGNKIPFDSTKPEAGAGPLTEFFKALVGSEFTLTIGKDMKVAKIEGRDEFLKKLSSTNQQMEPLLKQILSDESLKQMADPTFSVVPDKPVKAGDTWQKTSTLNMGPIGSFETTYKYLYEGPDDKDKKLQKIKFETTLKYSPPGPNAGGGLPFKILKADLQGKDSNGTMLFDNDKGRVASSTASSKLTGNLSIEIGGMASSVDLDQTQTTTVKTSDDNPIKKSS